LEYEYGANPGKGFLISEDVQQVTKSAAQNWRISMEIELFLEGVSLDGPALFAEKPVRTNGSLGFNGAKA
jgi:hypothetical protein